jgi:Xaa-Pro aminopeptidase
MRLEKLRGQLVDEQLDAIMITDPANRRYLSGFTGSAGTLFISADRALLATDFRYYEQVERQAPDFQLVKLTGRLLDVLPDVVTDLDIRRLGFEGDNLTVSLYNDILESLNEGIELVATSNVVEELRMQKDDDELPSLQRAVDITDAAYAHITAFVQPGMTERQIAWEIERFMRDTGAESTSFPIIVAAGPNGAMPHATPSDRPIEPSDPIVIDMGALVDGYHADLTRTFALDAPSDRYLEVYEIVLQAQKAALQNIQAGMTGKEADAIARTIIEQAGYGEQFGHGLGHGVGLVIHERPWLSHLERGDNVLRPGMVFSIEPGIYLPGEFGVRIEDLALLREDGLQTLSRAAKEPALNRQ